MSSAPPVSIRRRSPPLLSSSSLRGESWSSTVSTASPSSVEAPAPRRRLHTTALFVREADDPVRQVPVVADERRALDGPGDPVPDVLGSRPATDLDRVRLAATRRELRDLVAVVPRPAIADQRAAAVVDLQVEVELEVVARDLDESEIQHRREAVPRKS